MASPLSVSWAVTSVEYSFGLAGCQGQARGGLVDPGVLPSAPRAPSIASMVEEDETVEESGQEPPPPPVEASERRLPPPAIEKLRTVAGPMAGGTHIIVEGSGFADGCEVKLDRAPVKTLFPGPTE